MFFLLTFFGTVHIAGRRVKPVHRESPTGTFTEGVRMKIGFIGEGKVGTSLGMLFVQHGITVTGYFSKTPLHV